MRAFWSRYVTGIVVNCSSGDWTQGTRNCLSGPGLGIRTNLNTHKPFSAPGCLVTRSLEVDEEPPAFAPTLYVGVRHLVEDWRQTAHAFSALEGGVAVAYPWPDLSAVCAEDGGPVQPVFGLKS
jgi:hypothetical protein